LNLTRNTTITGEADGMVAGGQDSIGRRHGGVSATVDKTHYQNDQNVNNTDVVAPGDAAVANANSTGHEQAYAVSAAEGVSKAKSEASLDIDLPTARSGSASSHLNLTGTLLINKSESASASAKETLSTKSSDSSTESSSEMAKASEQSTKESSSSSSTDNSKLNVIIADHVKIGDGNQNITDETDYKVELQDNAQANATALNILNVSGRNNVAVAWNLASANGGAIAVNPLVGSGAGAGAAIVQVNVIKQTN
jgi:hypothetical protein